MSLAKGDARAPHAAMPAIRATLVCSLMLVFPACVETFNARVIGVSDGDTITVLHDGRPEKIRRSDIDCPEKKQAFGTVAKNVTASLVFGKTVILDAQGRDKYGRTIARVQLQDGLSVNRELVKRG